MSARWLVALTAVLALAANGCGCCRIAVDITEPDPEGERREEPPPDAEHADLGNAAFPANNSAKAVDHPWWLPELTPQKYRLGYKVPGDEAKNIRRAYHRWADSVGHKKVSDNSFQWRPPRRCFGGLHCVYDELDRENMLQVEPISELFRTRASSASLSAEQLAALVITFVQEIHYRIPDEEPFGVKAPALVVKDSEGDCDSKSLLAHIVLRSLGISSVLISSEAHKHTMLGLAQPAAGRSFTWQGRKYAFVELTAKRSPVGHVNPQLLRPNDWQVVAMGYKPPGRPPKSAPAPVQPAEPERGAADIITGGRIKVN